MTSHAIRVSGSYREYDGRIPSVAPSGFIAPPTGTGYVRYQDLHVPGDTLWDVVGKVVSGDILTFPEGDFTFSDFNANVSYSGLRVDNNCGGFIGSGRGTRFYMVANSSTKASDPTANPTTGTNPCELLSFNSINGLQLKNFQLMGTDQGMPYNGLRVSGCDNAVIDSLYLLGANVGTSNSPPGETFGLNVYQSSGVQLLNSELDGRRNGVRVASSNIGWNNASGAYVANTSTHHAAFGHGIAFWETTDIHTVNLVSQYNGTGDNATGKLGTCINHENSGGTILHESPTLYCDPSSGNLGKHVSFNSSLANTTGIQLTNVTHDTGQASSGCFTVSINDTYQGAPNMQTSLPLITKNGVALSVVDSTAQTGANPAANFIRYHSWGAAT